MLTTFILYDHLTGCVFKRAPVFFARPLGFEPATPTCNPPLLRGLILSYDTDMGTGSVQFIAYQATMR
ncbi:MAG: hypothetical protein D3903_18475 [Candidatus Electrothrix sp. GM3_4]|nr:hypothetical protein [Candidatus Electrothrix sp. GM3_4]